MKGKIEMIVFVILHYMSLEMTEKCIDTIKSSLKEQNYHIVIVDNASGNGTGHKLKRKYDKKERMTVILNEKNLGFAQGNNVGYEYAKKFLNPDFMVIMNNDVMIKDNDFVYKIYSIYEETEFSVLGPDIYACKTGLHQNPMRLNGYTRDEIIQIRNIRKRWLSVYSLYYVKLWSVEKLKVFIKKLIRWKSKDSALINPYALEKRIKNPVLHGACLIFSKRFIQAEMYAFNPDTFLYMEEDILHYTCLKKGYSLIYDSSILVEHMEDVATNMVHKSQYSKLKMKYKNLIKSCDVLIKLMNK